VSEHLLALHADASLQDWITALPSYQQSVITEMLQTRDPEAVAIAWLNARGQTDTAPLGAVQLGATLFYEKLLEQLRAFLCGTASEYEQDGGNWRPERRQAKPPWSRLSLVRWRPWWAFHQSCWRRLWP
jgi:hypothetical protein